MATISLKNMGPIKNCNINLDDFTILVGPQASGKSTIAKSVFFFRTIKDDICEAVIRKSTLSLNSTLFQEATRLIRAKFLQLFGSSRALPKDLSMTYWYDDTGDTSVSVSLEWLTGSDYIMPNYITFKFSQDILSYLNFPPEFVSRQQTQQELNDLFHDDFETVFIPAGRSIITLLTDQLSYIFTSMDETQKRSIDFCSQKYIEKILKIRPLFTEGANSYLNSGSISKTYRAEFWKLYKAILKGDYKYVDGEERLYLPQQKHYVKINFTSSGQQETVWVMNILLHQLANDAKTFIIIEEPEAHLYPNAQKLMTEMISLFVHNKNAAIVTTHSPYVLGSLNNLIYADKILNGNSTVSAELKKIISPLKTISHEHYNASFVDNRTVTPCRDEQGLIRNEIIDGASEDINTEYMKLFALCEEDEE